MSMDCVTASSVNMFKNKVDTYLRRAGYTGGWVGWGGCVWVGGGCGCVSFYLFGDQIVCNAQSYAIFLSNTITIKYM